ncbi:MAG: hypothetical protein ABIH50_00230 [bacterium]
MRLFKIAAFILGLFVLQTVILARLNLFGLMPDLVLVAVVIFAVFEERAPATVFAATLSLLQDLMSAGILLNTIIKVVISNIISGTRAGLSGDEFSFSLSMTALFSPVFIIARLIILNNAISPVYFIVQLVGGTLLNMAFVFLLFPLVKELTNAK